MSSDSIDGVVDKNYRVQGTENVFIAGCSVFPTQVGTQIRPCPSSPLLSAWRITLRRFDGAYVTSKFAAMIDRHWDGIAAYCRPENKVSLGFVEGLNNKIPRDQRRAYGS
jgi:hypothetical protein